MDQPVSDLVDDFHFDSATVELNRTNVSRYRLALTSRKQEPINIDLRTSRSGEIQIALRDVHDWVSIQLGPSNVLESLSAQGCHVHLEQLDRGHYWLGLTGPDKSITAVDLSSHGYIKAKIVGSPQCAS